jgi:hypothetical protein
MEEQKIFTIYLYDDRALGKKFSSPFLHKCGDYDINCIFVILIF